MHLAIVPPAKTSTVPSTKGSTGQHDEQRWYISSATLPIVDLLPALILLLLLSMCTGSSLFCQRRVCICQRHCVCLKGSNQPLSLKRPSSSLSCQRCVCVTGCMYLTAALCVFERLWSALKGTPLEDSEKQRHGFDLLPTVRPLGAHRKASKQDFGMLSTPTVSCRRFGLWYALNSQFFGILLQENEPMRENRK